MKDLAATKALGLRHNVVENVVVNVFQNVPFSLAILDDVSIA